MVCVPCIVIPVLLWVFHKFIRPYLVMILPTKYAKWLDTDKTLQCDETGCRFVPKSKVAEKQGTGDAPEGVPTKRDVNGTVNGQVQSISDKKED